MSYDFTTRPNRSGSGSLKWNAMYEKNPRVGSNIVPLSVADMELENPPQIKEALHRYLDGAVLGYTDATPAFVDACCAWQRRRHGWNAEDRWLVTSPGVVPALSNAVRAYSEPGDGVIIQPPVYHPFRSAVERNARTVVTNPLRVTGGASGAHHYEIDFDNLVEKAADPSNKLLILCSPHNPVGRVWSAVELRRMLDICIQNDVLVVCDEIHDDLVMPGQEHTALMAVADAGEYDRIVVCTAPSKTFNIAGCQASAIFIPDEARRSAYRSEMERCAQGELNAFAYPATIAAYNECEDWLDELIGLVWSNYQLLKGSIEASLPTVEVYPLEGTYLAWVDFRGWRLSDAELERFMTQEALLFLDEGYVFGEGGSGFERINLACPREVLVEAIDRLVRAAHEHGLDMVGERGHEVLD